MGKPDRRERGTEQRPPGRDSIGRWARLPYSASHAWLHARLVPRRVRRLETGKQGQLHREERPGNATKDGSQATSAPVSAACQDFGMQPGVVGGAVEQRVGPKAGEGQQSTGGLFMRNMYNPPQVPANRVVDKGQSSGTGSRSASLNCVGLTKSRKPTFLNIPEGKSAALYAGQMARTGVNSSTDPDRGLPSLDG